jgi:hypothetical protein
MIGSNWPEPLHAQSGFAGANEAPPLELTSNAMYGLGQLPEHGFGP